MPRSLLCAGFESRSGLRLPSWFEPRVNMDWYDPDAIDNEEDATDDANAGAVSRVDGPMTGLALPCCACVVVLAPCM
jgi:hypothetical protein